MKKVLYFTVFCALISCGNSQNSAVMQITPYYNVDSLIRSQVALLDSKRPSLEKRAWLKDEPDTITFSPDSAEWGRELEIFLQIDLNKPVLRDAYTVSNETGPEGEKIVAYIAKEAEDVQVDTLALYFQGDRLRKIVGSYRENSVLFDTFRKVVLQFEDFEDGVRVRAYQIDGAQKMILQDTVRYRIDAWIHYN